MEYLLCHRKSSLNIFKILRLNQLGSWHYVNDHKLSLQSTFSFLKLTLKALVVYILYLKLLEKYSEVDTFF